MTLVLNDFESAAVQDGTIDSVFRLRPKGKKGSRIYSKGRSYEISSVRKSRWPIARDEIAEKCGITDDEAKDLLFAQAILPGSPVYRHKLRGLPQSKCVLEVGEK